MIIWDIILFLTRSRRSTDRMPPSEGGDVGSIPAGSTKYSIDYIIAEVNISEYYQISKGRLAQLVERSLHTGEVTGSNPVSPTSPFKIENWGRKRSFRPFVSEKMNASMIFSFSSGL